MKTEAQPTRQDKRKHYVKPLLEEFGPVSALTKTSIFEGDFNLDGGGTFPNVYVSVLP
jgi:hypothetical protein